MSLSFGKWLIQKHFACSAVNSIAAVAKPSEMTVRKPAPSQVKSFWRMAASGKYCISAHKDSMALIIDNDSIETILIGIFGGTSMLSWLFLCTIFENWLAEVDDVLCMLLKFVHRKCNNGTDLFWIWKYKIYICW